MQWVLRFVRENRGRQASTLNRRDVESFLHQLMSRDRLAPKSRNQAASALAFFFREILGRDELATMPRAKEPQRAPSVLSHRQVGLVLEELSGKYRLLASLMYGTGLRLSEAHRLRLKDIDFDLYQIAVRDGKGAKDRWVMLPERLVPPLKSQERAVCTQHRKDVAAGAGWVALPHALDRKDKAAGFDAGWQYLFPSRRMSVDAATGRRGRLHLSPTAMQREIKKASRATGIIKPVTCHTLRRSFATQMLRAGYDARSVQRLMGHRDIRTTMLYVQAVTDAGIGMRSPLDRPDQRD
jgi:integron integrase